MNEHKFMKWVIEVANQEYGGNLKLFQEKIKSL
jgi:hypothetical protein